MTIRAALMTGPDEPIRLADLPAPEPGPGEVVLDTVSSEVCGTDVHLRKGQLAGIPWPIIPGHVSVGRVAESPGVRHDALGAPLAVGDLVTFLDVHGTCHACHQCTVAGNPNRCPRRRVYGISFSASEGAFGGWSEQILLKEGVRILKLPDGVGADRFIGGGCGLFTGFATVERSEMRMGDTVLVQGAGPVGLAAAAFAHLRGAGRVLMIGAPRARLELAAHFGVDRAFELGGDDTTAVDGGAGTDAVTTATDGGATIHAGTTAADAGLTIHAGTTAERRRERVMEETGGRGADVVLEASGNPAAVPEGLELLADGGRYVVAGHYTDAGPVPVNPHHHINAKHAEIRGQWGTDFRHLVGALRMLSRHGDRLPFERVVGGRYPLERAEEALQDVAALRVTKAIITPE